MIVHQPQKTKYRILGLIGQGQFGRVFCGCHRQTGQLVALKNLDKHRFPTHQFLRELRFLLQLSHPNIVTCKALEHSHKGRYLVMDYCEGGTLRNWMDRQEKLPLALSIKLVKDVLRGLEHANSRGIIHRDLKPENILLTLKSKGWVARISDFGIARLIQEMQEGSDNTGSPAYMAPERFYGQYSLRSDIYAVGIILYELVVGDRPFSGPPQQLMTDHLNRRATLPETVPPEVQTLILKALEKLPARRYTSATEMLVAIDETQKTLGLSESRLLVYSPPHPPSLPLTDHPMITQTVPEAIAAIAIGKSDGDQRWIYWAIADAVQCYPDQEPLNLDSLINSPKVTLPESIRHLKITPQGCIAITDQCLYHLTPHLGISPLLSAQLVAHIHTPFQADVNPQGTWIAAVTDKDEQTSLFIWEKPWHLTHTPRQIPLAGPIKQIQLLDLGHGVLWRSAGEKSSLEVFTRRGTLAGQWKLPFSVDRVIQGTVPYRVLVIPQQSEQTPLLMDLKPFRMRPIPIKLHLPVRVAIAPWGYVLGDWEGHLILLDEFGQVVGRILGPPAPMAIAMLSATLLLVTTEQPLEGHLHLIDLTQFRIDFVF